MDAEIREEYIKLYPPAKELFDLLDKGNPSIYKQMHVYAAAADFAHLTFHFKQHDHSSTTFTYLIHSNARISTSHPVLDIPAKYGNPPLQKK
jgi:hypothetical protein